MSDVDDEIDEKGCMSRANKQIACFFLGLTAGSICSMLIVLHMILTYSYIEDVAAVPVVAPTTLQSIIDREIDFKPYEASLETHGRLPIQLLEQYQGILEDHINVEPLAPIVNATPPWSLTSVPDCSSPLYSQILTGKVELEAKLVYDLIPFAYEIDVLEMRLYELNSSVDKFIVAESTYTHRLARKPLFFPRFWKRFEPFRTKIMYLVLDDAFVQTETRQHSKIHIDGDDWRIENVIRTQLWNRFVVANGLPPDHALVIHGDVDEIPYGQLVYLLKHCVLKPDALPISMALTFFRFGFRFVEPHRISHPVLSIRSAADVQRNKLGRLPEPRKWLTPEECGRWGFDLNRFGPIQMQLYKDLSVAEGGQIPRGDLGMLRNLDYAYKQSVAKGERLCCAHPQHASTDEQCGRLKPFIAVQNPDRYRGFLSS